MRFKSVLLFIIFVWVLLWALESDATTVSGTFRYNGQPFNGSMVVTLNYPSTTGSYINLNIPSGPIPVVNGAFTSFALDGNDTMLPKGNYYAFDLYDQYSNPVTTLNYYISGATFDLGTAVPTPVRTNNVSFLDLLGLRSISVQNLIISNTLVINGGTTISQFAISNVENIMGVLYSQAYNTANPSSTTCGIQEAENALPTAGGTIMLPPGPCNMNGTVTVTKPTTFKGVGSGGYADSSSFTTFQSPTVLTINTSFAPAFAITPIAGQTLSGVRFQDLAITSNGAAAADLVTVGNVSQSTAYTRDVVFDNVKIYKAVGNGIDIVGNVSGLIFRNSSSNNNVNSGIAITTIAPMLADDIRVESSGLQRNGGDGFQAIGSGSGRITINNSVASNNTTGDGVDVTSTATSAIFSSFQSKFTNNSTGVLLAAGTGHAITLGTVTSNSAFGVHVSSTGAASTQTLSLKDITWGSNTTADLKTETGVPYVLYYPQVSQTATIIDTGSAVRYITTSLTPTAFRPVAFTGVFTTCVMVGHSSTDVSCSGTATWLQPIVGSYYPLCFNYTASINWSTTPDTNGITRFVLGATALTGTSVSYYESSLQGGAAGSNTQAYCIAFQ